MKHVSPLRRLFKQAAAGVAAMAVTVSAFALTQQEPNMSLEQMAKSADEIIQGNVVSQNTRIVANSFETDYVVQISDNLKTRSGALNPGQSVTITVPGGSIQEPPLSQYVMGTAYLYKGEEVLLFLRQGSGREVRLPARSERAGEVSKLTTTYKVVGMNQGRFDVVTLKDTGEKVVTRMNLENYGLVNDSEAARRAMSAIANGQLEVIKDQLVRQKDRASDARDKDPLEFTAADGKTVKVEGALQKAETMKAMRNKAPIVQDYEEFKAQVKSFANSY